MDEAFPAPHRHQKLDMIFVGYGVVAPSKLADDFKGVDVRQDDRVPDQRPGHFDPSDPARLSEDQGPGHDAGRWTFE